MITTWPARPLVSELACSAGGCEYDTLLGRTESCHDCMLTEAWKTLTIRFSIHGMYG